MPLRTVVNLLVSPLADGQIVCAFVGAAVVRGLLAGGVGRRRDAHRGMAAHAGMD